jgi:putative flippase GtrA
VSPRLPVNASPSGDEGSERALIEPFGGCVPTLQRFGRFNLVGAAGVVVQVAVLSLAVHGLSLHYLGATAVAVTVAILHNFVWHWRWTWRDRAIPAAAAPQALLRFALVNGGLSLMANLVLMRGLVATAGVPVEPANLLAIATVGLLNFYLGDRAVFRPPPHGPVGSNSGPSRSSRQIGAPSRRIVAVSDRV